MKIGELSKLCGLSIDTLRFYEKIGLIEPPLRDKGGQRIYDKSILVWLEFLARLRETNMPLKQQMLYATLRSQGVKTTTLRRELLEEHLIQLYEDEKRLKHNINALRQKIEIYRQMEPTLMEPNRMEIEKDGPKDQ